MKITITIATIALLATACAADPVREAAWQNRTCGGKTPTTKGRQVAWLYTQGKYVCTLGNDLSQEGIGPTAQN